MFLGACAILRHSGGYQGRGGGPRFAGDGGGFHPPQQQYHQQRGGYGNSDDLPSHRGSGVRGYNNCNEGYANHPQRGDNHQQGYRNRSRSYEDDAQGHGRHHQGFENRQQVYGNRQHDDDRPSVPRRQKEQYLAQDADKLLRMKQMYKKAKDTKERVGILREARWLLRRTRIDPSTQDERSVSVVMNCAATFSISAEVFEQACQWMRSNIRGILPQNVALFANALGLLSPPEAKEVIVNEILPVVQSVMREMTPVEVVMVLQALQRLRITESATIQDELLAHLEPCISSMPVQQLSTLASVLHRHSMQTRDNARWKRIAHETLTRAVAGVGEMHSREAIVLLGAAPFVDASQEHICQLLARVTATSQFHTDDQVGELMSSILHIRQQVGGPTPELTAALEKLHTVLMVRLEKVSLFVKPRSATRIWNYAHASNVELSSTIQENMCASLIKIMTFRSVSFRDLARLVSSLSTQKLPSTEILAVIANYSVGVRPPRPSKALSHNEAETPEDVEDQETLRAEARDALYGRHFGSLTDLRIGLENSFATNSLSPNEALSKTLPEHLLKHATEALPRQMLVAVVAIALAPAACSCRNKDHDAAVLAAVLKVLEKDPEKFTSQLNPTFVDWCLSRIPADSSARDIVEALKKAVAQ